MIERFDELIHTIYEGCTDSNAWPRIVGAVAEQLDADKGLLLTPFNNGAEGFTYAHAISSDDLARCAPRYPTDGVWIRRLAERDLAREGIVVLGQELISDAELRSHAWYREILAELNIFRMITATVFGADDPDIPATCVSFYRGAESPSFDEEHRAMLQRLVPHLSRALSMMFRLRDADDRVAASLHALSRIRHGVLLLGEDGSVQFVNEAAERILGREDGLRLVRDSAGYSKLIADHSRARASLEEALRSGSRPLAPESSDLKQTVAVRRTNADQSYTVEVSYLPESNPFQSDVARPHAMVFIKDDSIASRFNPDALQNGYRLTQSEARAALALCDGGRLETVAAQLNISLNTLKTHLKSIYVKTSVDNRAALTKLILSLTAA